MGQVLDWVKKWQNPDGKVKTALPPTKKPAPPLDDEALAKQVDEENDPNMQMSRKRQLEILDQPIRRIPPRKKSPED